MNFMDSMKKELNTTKQKTENGALGFKTTGKELLDLNFMVPEFRENPEKAWKLFERAFYQDRLHAVKWLFYLRDVRGGLGERNTFREIISHLATYQPEMVTSLIPLVAEYGRFDDLNSLLYSKCGDKVIQFIGETMVKDIESMEKNQTASLLAKWLPKINSKTYNKRADAKYIAEKLGLSERDYRKLVSKLNKYIQTTETKMSANEWGSINYEAVPSCANLRYSKAFMRHDEKRRTEYLKKLEKGETKINSSVVFPHQIVNGYSKRDQKYQVLESMWKNLPDYVKDDGKTLVVRDGSGSMTCSYIPNTLIPIIDIATAICIYFAERISGEFNNKFITFGSIPEIVSLKGCDSLYEKLSLCENFTDCSNTDLEKVFYLILNTAIKNHMKQEDMPKNILIISDMEFDSATTGDPDKTLFENIDDQFEKAGYKTPRLVFWNVGGRTNTIPVQENEMGVALVSGYSTAIVNMVLSGDIDPYKCLISQLDTERYALVEEAIKDFI